MSSSLRKFAFAALGAGALFAGQLQAATAEHIQQSIAGAQQWLLENIEWLTAPDGADPGTARFVRNANGNLVSSSYYLGNTCTALAGLADTGAASQIQGTFSATSPSEFDYTALQAMDAAAAWIAQTLNITRNPDTGVISLTRPGSESYQLGLCLMGMALHDSAGNYTELLQNLKAHFLNNQSAGNFWDYSVTAQSSDLSTGQHAVMGIFFANERLELSETTFGEGHADTDGQAGAPYTDWPDRILDALETNRVGNVGDGFFYRGSQNYTASRSMTGAGLWTLFMIGEGRRLANGEWANPLVPAALDRLHECMVGQSLNGWDTNALLGCGAFGASYTQDYIYPYMFFAVSKALGVLIGVNNPLVPSDAVFDEASGKYYVGGVAPENEVTPLLWSEDFTNAALPYFDGDEFSGVCDSGFARCSGTPGEPDFRSWWLDTGGSSSGHGDSLATGWMLMSLAFANANAPAVTRFDEQIDTGCDGVQEVEDGVTVCVPEGGGEAEEIPFINAPVTLRSGNGRTLISSLNTEVNGQEVPLPMRERVQRNANPRRIVLPAGALNFRLTLGDGDEFGEVVLDFDRDPLATVACDPAEPQSFVTEDAGGNLVLKEGVGWFKLTSGDFWDAVAAGDATVTIRAASRDGETITSCRLLVTIRDNGLADSNPAVGVIDDPGAPGFGGDGGGAGGVSPLGAGGGGCSLGDPNGRFDPTLPALLLAGLGALAWRRRVRRD